jgi:hypothetical protein
MALPKLQEPHFSSGGAGGVTITFPEDRASLIDWQAVGRALAGVPEAPVNPDPYGIEERKARRRAR